MPSWVTPHFHTLSIPQPPFHWQWMKSCYLVAGLLIWKDGDIIQSSHVWVSASVCQSQSLQVLIAQYSGCRNFYWVWSLAHDCLYHQTSPHTSSRHTKAWCCCFILHCRDCVRWVMSSFFSTGLICGLQIKHSCLLTTEYLSFSLWGFFANPSLAYLLIEACS